jgi:hypothetical protein
VPPAIRKSSRIEAFDPRLRAVTRTRSALCIRLPSASQSTLTAADAGVTAGLAMSRVPAGKFS